jgi:hypothetical protein
MNGLFYFILFYFIKKNHGRICTVELSFLLDDSKLVSCRRRLPTAILMNKNINKNMNMNMNMNMTQDSINEDPSQRLFFRMFFFFSFFFFKKKVVLEKGFCCKSRLGPDVNCVSCGPDSKCTLCNSTYGLTLAGGCSSLALPSACGDFKYLLSPATPTSAPVCQNCLFLSLQL